eukprot:2050249-Rhodomonas_salina.1
MTTVLSPAACLVAQSAQLLNWSVRLRGVWEAGGCLGGWGVSAGVEAWWREEQAPGSSNSCSRASARACEAQWGRRGGGGCARASAGCM